MESTQAVLITAYKNAKQLNHLIEFFPEEKVNIYIHIDRKNSHIESQVKQKSNVFKFSTFHINWGSYNHTRAILFLCNIALENVKNKYFHLISGEDFPCAKDFSTFTKGFDFNKNYLNFFPLPYSGWSGNGGLDRINEFHSLDIFDIKNPEGFKLMSEFEKSKIINRNIFFTRNDIREEFHLNLYGGSTWWSLGREILEYITDFTTENPVFFNRFRHTFVSEELYFQTVLLNSKFSSNIENENLRYIDWNSRNNSGVPCYLDETDFDKLYNGDKLFARKLSLDIILKYQNHCSTL